jgi:hypothetical protein
MEQEQPINNSKREWQQNNKEKIALAGRRYYEKMKSDPEFMEMKRKRSKQQREKRKQIKLELKAKQGHDEIPPEGLLSHAPHDETIPETTEQKTKKPSGGRPRKY